MNVIMPQMGETVEEGTIVKWWKNVGDSVSTEDIILEIETDKVGMEVPAPVDGILNAIHVQEGETVAVGAVLAEVSGASAGAENDPGATEQPMVGQSATIEADPVPTATSPTTPVETSAEVSESEGFDAQGPLSPVVKKLLSENKLDPAQIVGSGKDGRLKRDDILAYMHSGAGTEKDIVEADQPIAGSTEVIPFTKLRKKTAEHMLRSKAVSPHVLQAVEVDFQMVAQARQKFSERWKSAKGFSLSYLPFILRSLCISLPEFPNLNASVEGESLRLHQRINLGIAVDVELEGLMVPVIKDADEKNLAELSYWINDLARRARDNQLVADDLTEGTYTVSNPGGYGTLFTAPIIAQPQVAILSTDGIKKRPVVVESPEGDSIAIRAVGILAQSFDHRAVDGAYSAAFLQLLKTVLENTDWENELSQVM